jgi:hypothetical protein
MFAQLSFKTYIEMTVSERHLCCVSLLCFPCPPDLEETGGLGGQRLDLEARMRTLLHIEQRLR